MRRANRNRWPRRPELVALDLEELRVQLDAEEAKLRKARTPEQLNLVRALREEHYHRMLIPPPLSKGEPPQMGNNPTTLNCEILSGLERAIGLVKFADAAGQKLKAVKVSNNEPLLIFAGSED